MARIGSACTPASASSGTAATAYPPEVSTSVPDDIFVNRDKYLDEC